MKITKTRLRQIIKEEVQRLAEDLHGGGHTVGSGPTFTGAGPGNHPPRGFPDDYSSEGEDHDQGFIAGYLRNPAPLDASYDYNLGHERGGNVRDSDDQRGIDRDPEDILRGQDV